MGQRNAAVDIVQDVSTLETGHARRASGLRRQASCRGDAATIVRVGTRAGRIDKAGTRALAGRGVTRDAVRRFAVESTRESAELEGRTVPAGYVRSPRVTHFLEERRRRAPWR
jgi:hypothetical protein